jgi:hypothetical protein
MIALNYTLTTFQELLIQLANVLGSEVKDHHIVIPAHAGTGFLKIIKINEGLEALVYNIRYTTNWFYAGIKWLQNVMH